MMGEGYSFIVGGGKAGSLEAGKSGSQGGEDAVVAGYLVDYRNLAGAGTEAEDATAAETATGAGAAGRGRIVQAEGVRLQSPEGTSRHQHRQPIYQEAQLPRRIQPLRGGNEVEPKPGRGLFETRRGRRETEGQGGGKAGVS